MKPKISAIIIAYNEERFIADCLSSVSFADEIIVIDNESIDDTAKIAKKYTKNVYTAKRVGYVEPIRNLALKKASGDWILFVDADETVSHTLGEKLQEISENDNVEAVYIPRKNIIFNKWIRNNTGWWPDNVLRFFKKGKVIWPDEIHSQPVIPEATLTLEPEERYAIIHNNYTSVTQYLQKLDSYTSAQAKEYLMQSNTFSVSEMLRYPAQEFLSRLFAREGYKDGLHGLVLAILQGFSHFIVMVKVWESSGFKERDDVMPIVEKEINQLQKELTYWILTVKIHELKNPLKKAILKGKRKVR